MSTIKLNEEQTNALSKLNDFLNCDKQQMFLLEGAAGSGKTTTISQFISKVIGDGKISEICMCSPTHKALKVMAEMCDPDIKQEINFSTLHSALGLKHEITYDGTEVFVRDKKIVTKFPFYELVIIDESSMLADQLFHEIIEQNYRKIKVLFIGDSNQINPINHAMSIPMTPEKRMEFNIGHIRLEKIVRQAEDNPIIALSQQIVKGTFVFESGQKRMKDECGVVMISPSQKSVVQQLVQYYFLSPSFDNDANFCKIIAWRNVTVNFYNKMVRNCKYGPAVPKIVLGEKLLVDKPIKNNAGHVMFNTNDEIVVTNIELKEKKMYDTTWKYYDCSVKGDIMIEQIHILHESEELKYSNHMKDIAKAAKAEIESNKRLKKWKEYFSFAENFAQIKYNYAITVHNSQGSTYDNCLVINSDIEYNQRQDEKKRIQYTAVTRPRKMLYIL